MNCRTAFEPRRLRDRCARRVITSKTVKDLILCPCDVQECVFADPFFFLVLLRHDNVFAHLKNVDAAVTDVNVFFAKLDRACPNLVDLRIRLCCSADVNPISKEGLSCFVHAGYVSVLRHFELFMQALFFCRTLNTEAEIAEYLDDARKVRQVWFPCLLSARFWYNSTAISAFLVCASPRLRSFESFLVPQPSRSASLEVFRAPNIWWSEAFLKQPAHFPRLALIENVDFVHCRCGQAAAEPTLFDQILNVPTPIFQWEDGSSRDVLCDWIRRSGFVGELHLSLPPANGTMLSSVDLGSGICRELQRRGVRSVIDIVSAGLLIMVRVLK